MNKETISINSVSDFEKFTARENGPVAVDFWAPWCGPCQALGPTLEDAARDVAGKGRIGKVNVDENPDLAKRFGIRSIPTILYFNEGEVKDQTNGLVSKDAIVDRLVGLN